MKRVYLLAVLAIVVAAALGIAVAKHSGYVMVSYGSEEGGWDVNRLHVAHNTFINHGWLPGWFHRWAGLSGPHPWWFRLETSWETAWVRQQTSLGSPGS